MAQTQSPDPPDREASANTFVLARRELKLSQPALAKKLNTSLYALARWESGHVEPSQDILRRLAALMGSDDRARTGSSSAPPPISFPSTGIGADTDQLLLFGQPTVRLRSEPRSSFLDGLYKNRFWGESEDALHDILHRQQEPAPTREQPVNEEISAGKNTYTYDAHTYHTKVPPQGIAALISQYLPRGGVVLDPFAGSGMTGVAGRHLGCDVILNELSPAASFIAHSYNRTVDPAAFEMTVRLVLSACQELRYDLYTTKCRECNKEVEQLYTVWSYELECNHCGEVFRLWDHCRRYGENVRQHKLLRQFPCPHCRKEVNKSYLRRHDSVPVFVGYRCCSRKIVEHPISRMERQRLDSARVLLEEYADHIPRTPLPDGVNLNQPKRHGLTSVDKFYTPRNLAACGGLWRAIKSIDDPELGASVGFVFTSLYRRVTRLAEYRFWGGSGNTPTWNVPHISNEANVFVTFARKAREIAAHLKGTAATYRGSVVVRTGAAGDLSFLPSNSIDMIFTDPPFGGNINYSEMNLLWESWLGSFTDTKSEAIINRTQRKDLARYQDLLTESLKEAYRVLRPGHWMVLVFMNSSEKVWRALRDAIIAAGFSVEQVNIFDKQHGTFKQYVSKNTAGSDLILHCRKRLTERLSTPDTAKEPRGTEIAAARAFVRGEAGRIPVLPFLHVARKAEVDMRTLYSRYVASAIHEGREVLDFNQFRQEAEVSLGELR